MYKIDDITKCHNYLDRLRTNGWRLWQMQYGWDDEHGFHAWFWKKGEDDIELLTYSEEVQREIEQYELK